MIVGESRYGTPLAVANLVGDIISTGEDTLSVVREFSSETRPNVEHVEDLLDNYSAEINLKLANSRYQSPLTMDEDPSAYKYLSHACSCMVASMLLTELPAEAYMGEGGDGLPRGRLQRYSDVFRRALMMIEEQKLVATRGDTLPVLHGLRFGGTRKAIIRIGQFDNTRGV